MKVAVVIPCFEVKAHIVEVLSAIGPEVSLIFVVDDACPEKSGEYVREVVQDPRVNVIFHSTNQGVGGAVITGYYAAMEAGADVVVKIDGDGQMDPRLIQIIAGPVLSGRADYSKGDRFDNLDDLLGMPKHRILGNAVLSFWSKFSSGYWSITDPTNGFTAIHRNALERINFDKVSRSYFFESDMLFRLGIAKCVVADVPMASQYGTEKSNLSVIRVLFEFPFKHSINLLKRIFYLYYLRETNVGSFELPGGISLIAFGIFFAAHSYLVASEAGVATPAGQVTASAVAIILGVQLLLSFLSFDVQMEPKSPKQGG